MQHVSTLKSRNMSSWLVWISLVQIGQVVNETLACFLLISWVNATWWFWDTSHRVLQIISIFSLYFFRKLSFEYKPTTTMNSNQKSVDYLQQDFRNNRVDIKHSVQTELHELITSSAKQRQVREINNSNLIILGGLISSQKLMLVTAWGVFSCPFTSHF